MKGERIIKRTIQIHPLKHGGESRSGAMQNASEKTCQNREFKRLKQTPEKHKIRFWMFIWPRNWGTPHTHTHRATQGARALPTVTGTAPRQPVLGLSGQWAAALPTHSCRQCPPPPPQHPEAGRGQGKPDGGRPTSTVSLKAGEKKSQA